MRRRAVIAAVSVAALALAGCGSGDDDTSDRAAPPPAPPPAQDSGAEPPPVGDGEGGVKLTEIGEFSEPVYVVQPPTPDGEPFDLFVVEKGGAIRVVRDGKVQVTPFLDLFGEVSTGTEQGLLSMAFAPDYVRSGRFYVDYTDTEGDTRIVEYRRSRDDPLRADESTRRELLFIDQPFENHNGGLLLFGPDGYLYTGMGDGGSGGDPERNGQNLGTLLGKLLRIDPSPGGGEPYGIPADNPFAGIPGALPEIYSYGLRNPWRFSFDRVTDDLFIGDVGQSEQEEIDAVAAGRGAGANFGWSAFEGTARFNEDQTAPGAIPPQLTYGREGGCSVTGGYVVRDPNLESLYGRYIYGDYCAGQLRSFIPSGEGARDDRALGLEVPALSSFGEDNAGRIYAVSLDGPVYRLDHSN
jgi:glucose/arabinose dehydrogenase